MISELQNHHLMEKIGIETTQNVMIEHEVANLGERILAQLLDFAFMFIYFIIMIFLLTALRLENFGWVYILFLPLMFYSLINELVFNGQSLGKLILKIKVMRKDGSEPNIGNYLIRWLFRIVDVWLTNGAVAIIVIIAKGTGQRLGDLATGTMVVKMRTRVMQIDSIYKKLSEDYKLVYPEVRMLTDEDVNTINDVIKHLRKNHNQTSMVLLNEVVSQIQKKTGIKNSMHPRLFLETIIKDYNYVNKE